MRTAPRTRAEKADALNGDDGGFVMVWLALLLLVLLAFCGFGIDVANWWYIGQKEQRAADAAALAGSIYMPNDVATARVDRAEGLLAERLHERRERDGRREPRAAAEPHPRHRHVDDHELLRRPGRVQQRDDLA